MTGAERLQHHTCTDLAQNLGDKPGIGCVMMVEVPILQSTSDVAAVAIPIMVPTIRSLNWADSCRFILHCQVLLQSTLQHWLLRSGASLPVGSQTPEPLLLPPSQGRESRGSQKQLLSPCLLFPL